MGSLKEVASYRMFDGHQKFFSHESKELGCSMNFSLYLPPQKNDTEKFPVIYWLSGLECTEKNFTEKSGAQRFASEVKVIIVAPDTSPRGLNIPGENDSWDFGTGAGFYVDATQEPWKKNYRMYSYVTKELPELINSNFPVVLGKASIMGHSMGGHGALICALKNPGLYRSVSAFAPIANPSQCRWGKKAFGGYLGSEEAGTWSEWDATELVKKYNGPDLHIRIDQGGDDQFYKDGQLLPQNFVDACRGANVPVLMQIEEGYGHSYYFVTSFIKEHVLHHARILKET